MNTNQIKAAEPGAVLWDDKVRGLHLRVFPQSRAFYVYFRVKGSGRERRPKIGEWPAFDIISAREAASKMLRMAAQGIDPITHRNAEASKPTVDQLCDRYMERHGDKKKSAASDRNMISGHIKPRLGSKLVADITYSDIEDIHFAITKKGLKTRANRVVSLLSKMFELAEKWEFRPRGSNPCRGITRNKEVKRKRYMTMAEAPAIAEAIEFYQGEHPAGAAFLLLLIFTGARVGEIASAKWDWLRDNRLHLPDSKTGEKVIRLPEQALDALAALPRTSGTITGLKYPRHIWSLVCKRAGVEGLRLHDLRHSYASAGISAGLELARIGELLGHTAAQTTKRYAHLIDEVAQSSAQRVADELSSMMAASSRIASGPSDCGKESALSSGASARPHEKAE